MCTNARKFLFQHTQNRGFMKIFHIKKSIIWQKLYQKINKKTADRSQPFYLLNYAKLGSTTNCNTQYAT